MSSLILLPAVDVANGQSVRLVQGDASSETSFGDPLSTALDWQACGAKWIHLVDLDAAFNRGENRALLSSVVDKLDIQVELSGGIIDDDSLQAALSTGCSRVKLGTAALENMNWVSRVIQEFGDRIAVCIDVRGNRLAARGSNQEGGDLWETLTSLESAGCSRYVLTDVTKDGTLLGPNIELLRNFCARTQKPVIASGGISNLADITELRTLVESGVEGAIVGKALYAKAFTLEEAIIAAGDQKVVS
jgi:phosphoribosylanthranilate isomerase